MIRLVVRSDGQKQKNKTHNTHTHTHSKKREQNQLSSVAEIMAILHRHVHDGLKAIQIKSIIERNLITFVSLTKCSNIIKYFKSTVNNSQSVA